MLLNLVPKIWILHIIISHYMISYGYIIMIIVDFCMILFYFDCIMQLKKSYHIATNVCSRKSATTFSDFPVCSEVARLYEVRELGHKVTPHMCTIFWMTNSYFCGLFSVAIDIITDKLSLINEMYFVHVLHWVHAVHQGMVYSSIGKICHIWVLFLVSSVNTCSKLIWCMETLITYHM